MNISTAAQAFNQAADEVLELADADDTSQLRDAVNLVVNAGLYFLEHPGSTLTQAIDDRYSEDPSEVMSWISDL